MPEEKHKHTNQLINETSPYMLQHAHNPVNWYAWSDEAFEKAKREDKPVFVSIGYAACHWCHVMERESFENEDVADFMNKNFINIKVDREERPDVDGIYMEAVQAMTGSGGWPLNVFLTPDKKPFFGGTYFPPKRAYNRSSWMETLQGIHEAFEKRRNEIELHGEKILKYITQSHNVLLSKSPVSESEDVVQKNIFAALESSFDTTYGGFGTAPKFPSSFAIQYLLRDGFLRKNDEAMNHALLTLRQMIRGGIYDQIGGGFARYSTDQYWLAPHFEKMLYDNALLISALCDAYKITHEKEFESAIRQTLTFVQRELTDVSGGFYASLDADSEGVEGKFYVWSKKEFDEILSDESTRLQQYYDVTEEGNWEEENILHRAVSDEVFSKNHQIDQEELQTKLEEAKRKLFDARSKRIRPALDHKMILSWNALMVSAFAMANSAIGDEEFKLQSERSLKYLLKSFRKSKNDFSFYHNSTSGKAAHEANLDDYACLIQACLDVYEITFDDELLHAANSITEFVWEHFSDSADGMFYFSSDEQHDLVVRKKDFYDGVEPSGNSVMAANFFRLAIIFDKQEYKDRADRMIEKLNQAIQKYPLSFSNWAMLLQSKIYSTNEIAIVGENAPMLAKQLQELFIPFRVIMVAEKEESKWTLLKGKFVAGKTLIYLCRNYSCQQPVETVEELKVLLS